MFRFSLHCISDQLSSFGTRKMLKLFALLFCFGLSRALVLQPPDYTDCGSTGVVHEVRVVPCDSMPCNLPQGSTASIEILFTPKTALDTLDSQVFAVIAGSDVPYRGVSRKGCDTTTKSSGGPGCPLTDLAEKYTYKANVEIKSSYPQMALAVKFKLSDAVCVSFKVQVVKPITA